MSRWSVKYCATCQTHLEVKAFMRLQGLPAASVESAQYEVEIHTRDGVLTQARPAPLATFQKRLFRMEVR